jgi:hypothetical protein
MSVLAVVLVGLCGCASQATDATDAPTVWTPSTSSEQTTEQTVEDSLLGKGEPLVQDFLGKVNGGDAAGAKSLLCKERQSDKAKREGLGLQSTGEDVNDAISGQASVEMRSASVIDSSDYFSADLKGTFNGAPLDEYSARISAFLEQDGWCVYTFFVL